MGSSSLHDHESLVRVEILILVLLGRGPASEVDLAGRLPSRARQLYLRDEHALTRAYAWRSRITLGLLRGHLGIYHSTAQILRRSASCSTKVTMNGITSSRAKTDICVNESV